MSLCNALAIVVFHPIVLGNPLFKVITDIVVDRLGVIVSQNQFGSGLHDFGN